MKRFFTAILVLTSLISFGQNPVTDDLWKLYNARDFKSVMDKAKPLIENDPNNTDLNLIVGRTCTDLADFAKALPYLEFTVNNDKDNSWKKAWAFGYLGTCYFMLQKYEEAEKSLNACINLNVTKNATKEAMGKSLLFGFNEFYKSWKIVETDKFRFHFQNMSEAEMEKYAALREQAFKEINGFFQSSLPKKIDFFVWGSREDAKRLLGLDLGFAKPYFCVVHSYFQQTVGHEMTHVISDYCTTSLLKTRFINEGTAVAFDLTRQDRLKIIKDWIAKNNRQISIKDSWANGDTAAEEIFYPLAGLFVNELIKNFGRDKFIQFFSNQSYDNAKSLFGDELDKMIQIFENKINK